MKIFYINADNGDGSSRTEFYDSQECIDYLTSESYFDCDSYRDGDGGSWSWFEVPDGTPISGIDVRSIDDIYKDEAFYG